MRPILFLLPALVERQYTSGKRAASWGLRGSDDAPRSYLSDAELDDVDSGAFMLPGSRTFARLQDEARALFELLNPLMLLVTLAGYDITAVHLHNTRLADPDEYLTFDLVTWTFGAGHFTGTSTLPAVDPWDIIGATGVLPTDYGVAILFEMRPRTLYGEFVALTPISIFQPNADGWAEILDGDAFALGEGGFALLSPKDPTDFDQEDTPAHQQRPGGTLPFYVSAIEANDDLASGFAPLLYNIALNLESAWIALVTAEEAYDPTQSGPDPTLSVKHGLLPMLLPRGWVITSEYAADAKLIRAAGELALECIKDPSQVDRLFDFQNTVVFYGAVQIGHRLRAERGDAAELPTSAALGAALTRCITSVYAGYAFVPRGVEGEQLASEEYLPESVVPDILTTYSYLEAALMLQDMGAVQLLRHAFASSMSPEWTDPDLTGFYEQVPLESEAWTEVYGDSSPSIDARGALYPLRSVNTLQINQAGRTGEGWIQFKDASVTPTQYTCSRIYLTDIQNLEPGHVRATFHLFEPTIDFNETPPTGGDFTSLPGLYQGSYVVSAYASTLSDPSLGLTDFATALGNRDEGTAALERKPTVILTFMDADDDDAGVSTEVWRFVAINDRPFMSPRRFMADPAYGTARLERQLRPIHSVERANIALTTWRVMDDVVRWRAGTRTPAEAEAAFLGEMEWLGDPKGAFDAHLLLASTWGQALYANSHDGAAKFDELVDMIRAGARGDCQGLQNFYGVGDVHSGTEFVRHYNWYDTKAMLSGDFMAGVNVGGFELFIEKQPHAADDEWDGSARYLGFLFGGGVSVSAGFSLFEVSTPSRMWTNQRWEPSDFTGSSLHVYGAVGLSLGVFTSFDTTSLNSGVGLSFFFSDDRGERNEGDPEANIPPDPDVEHVAISLCLPMWMDWWGAGWSLANTAKLVSLWGGAGVDANLAWMTYVGGVGSTFDSEAAAMFTRLARTEVVDVPLATEERVHFAVDHYELTPFAQYHLRELAALYRNEFENPEGSLEIVGYCDRTGSYAYNERLSRQRAETVLQFLYAILGKGLRTRLPNIDLRGRGELLAEAEGLEDEVDAQIYRRVTIKLNGRNVSRVSAP